MGNKIQHTHKIFQGNKPNANQIKLDTLTVRLSIPYKDQLADSQVIHVVQVIKPTNQLTTVNHTSHNPSHPFTMIPNFNYQDPKTVDHPQHRVVPKILHGTKPQFNLVMIHPNRRPLRRLQAKTTSQTQTRWERRTSASHLTQPPRP